ncbi:hypothetical protein G6F40_016405 [Rhizopus arrhizus]|nr:hypothetical protein G6F40_016405 [Rhizopus arrhizus]
MVIGTADRRTEEQLACGRGGIGVAAILPARVACVLASLEFPPADLRGRRCGICDRQPPGRLRPTRRFVGDGPSHRGDPGRIAERGAPCRTHRPEAGRSLRQYDPDAVGSAG